MGMRTRSAFPELANATRSGHQGPWLWASGGTRKPSADSVATELPRGDLGARQVSVPSATGSGP